ncbi:MAG: isoprenyl transferase [Geminicoccaceae bacterium]|nr:isoprenyl transferase [Geminicoccaceae bacterium]MCB9966552.1 isoprenyl transferase [Geminicoccaceae bacterium]HRY22766.1 isoprenyl transferase [Geminicoccaceae bacterium]
MSAPALRSATPATGASAAPVHVAIIMDGNRRWARARGMPPVFGHRRGADAVRRAVEACGNLGVRYLTLYAFSSENWQRPAGEVTELMNLLRFYLRKEIEALHRNGVRLRVIGDRSRLDRDILELIDNAEALTREHQALELIVALNYGARDEIVRATRRLAAAAVAGELAPETIDHGQFAAALDTSGVPDPDLLIRTSGEQRISNFLLWQLAYTELVFLDVHWPDFSEEHLRLALEEFGRRERRYGACAG